ncbi:MAG: WcbI family polysaccharide biosynthesis putative acetyltransferase [Acidibrevibacterium sp.]|uniref:WcbI family polysaccharide biosynthesis putative acetyltransferase n=1 Tax=Acidibrevibacterium sp. TaxID=2606776 RepID=UPI003D011CE2
MRRVVFVGNCQAQALTDAFNRHIAPFTGERGFHVPAYHDLDEASRATLASADVIVDLVFDFAQRTNIAELGLDKPVVTVPYVNCNFLWPYAYEEHPSNAQEEFIAHGPYPAQLGDAYLNRLIRENVPAEDAAARYLDLDINQKVRLDRRLEMNLALQKQRDEKTGFEVASLMERHFREEPIFLTPDHPNRRIFLHVVERCFEQLGVPSPLITRLPHVIRRSFFPQEALPVHPRLAAHFGLAWANEATRYPFWLDGDFTFAEFVHRYLRFAYDKDFAKALGLCNIADQRLEVIARLRAGLTVHPESHRAWSLLSHILIAVKDIDGAVDAAKQAMMFARHDAEHAAHLGNLLTNVGEIAAAGAAYERAVALEPEHTPWLRLLAGHWERQGKRAEAGALAAMLAQKDPLDYELHVQRGHLLAGRGDSAGAVMAFSHALGLAPHIEGVRAARSHALAALARWEEAIADARAALAETPENRDLRRHLGHLLLASGDSAGAEAVFREAIRADPSDPEPYRGLAAMLTAQGQEEAAARLSAAIACAFEGAAPPPPEDTAPLAEGVALFEAGDFTAAADAFRATPETAEQQSWLAHAEDHAGRRAAAIEAAWRAVALAPHEARYFEHLGHFLAGGGENSAAERAFRRAIQLEPTRAGALIALGHVLYALKRWPEGIEVTRAAIALRPDDPDYFVHLGNLLAQLSDLAGAEASFAKALALAPGRPDVRQRLAEIWAAQGLAAAHQAA